jgi:endonuclease/exonuclease/phosphatase family metal-dependent hydrolase
MAERPRLRVATWNIHMGRGSDGRRDLERIARVIRGLEVDCIGLQEVDNRREAGADDLTRLAAATGMQAVAGPTMTRPGGDYGNALLSRWPVTLVASHDLSVAGREPRGLLHAAVDWRRDVVEVAVTHLGLRPFERRRQVERLLELLPGDRARPLLLLGDFNEWLLWGRPLRWLHRRFGRAPVPATFPSRWPLFRLDRILAAGPLRLQRVRAVNTELTRSASDHLPVVADIEPGS